MEESLNSLISEYRAKTVKRLNNNYLFALAALLYAYRGKISGVERILLGVAGSVVAYQNYKSKKELSVLDHIKTYGSEIISPSNSLEA